MHNSSITQDTSRWIAPTSISSATTVESTYSLNDLARYIRDGYIILWQHHGVFVIPVQAGDFTPPTNMEKDQASHMVRARAFNHDREWHVWRTESGLQGRKREDRPDGQATHILDAKAKLRGVVIKQLDDRIPSETWVIQTRNYIAYNTFHHAGYIDSRFINIIKIAKETQS